MRRRALDSRLGLELMYGLEFRFTKSKMDRKLRGFFHPFEVSQHFSTILTTNDIFSVDNCGIEDVCADRARACLRN